MNTQETVKDRARQAYLDQQTQDSEGGCGQPIGFIYGFIAGEESAQSRIKTLESALVDMAKIQKENYGDSMSTHILAADWAIKYQELLSELKKEKG